MRTSIYPLHAFKHGKTAAPDENRAYFLKNCIDNASRPGLYNPLIHAKLYSTVLSTLTMKIKRRP